MVTSQTFVSYKLVTLDRDQVANSTQNFGTTSQATPDTQESFQMKISEDESKNTITYLVAVLEAVIT